MTLMQVAIVACLGMKKAPGRSAVKPRKDLPETVLSRRGSFGATVKKLWSVFCQGPICKKNLYKLDLDRKTESVLEGNTFPEAKTHSGLSSKRNTLSISEDVIQWITPPLI